MSSFRPDPPAGLRLLLQPLTTRYLDQVLAVEQASFAQPWSRLAFIGEIAHPATLPLAALTLPGQSLVAYLILMLVAGEAQVQNLAVHPAWRGRGLGRWLLWRGLDEAARRGMTRATLEVRRGNVAARRLYASLGFEAVGLRPGYYAAENEDAILLDCDLAPWRAA